jgi:hypothetical protein
MAHEKILFTLTDEISAIVNTIAYINWCKLNKKKSRLSFLEIKAKKVKLKVLRIFLELLVSSISVIGFFDISRDLMKNSTG